jgi:subtilisin-like proprotein convertase family protein
MPLALRTFGGDNNGPQNVVGSVGIPVPVGVQDGDTILVGIAASAGNVVTPPDDEWQRVASTDPSISPALTIFWRTALCEPARWVFALATPDTASGACAVYAGADPFDPVDVAALATNASAASTTIPPFSASLDGEDAVLWLAAGAEGTYTPPTGYLASVHRTQVPGPTLDLFHRSIGHSGQVAGGSAAFSTAATGAAVLVALRPSAATLTTDDVRGRIVAALPRGVERVYGLEPGEDFYKFFGAIAEVLRLYGFTLAEILRAELSPATAVYKLVEWERVFGIASSRIALGGTIPQRQAQVVAAWRRAAGQGSTPAIARAILGPLLGYTDPAQLEVIECPRASLDAITEQDIAPFATIPALGQLLETIAVPDQGAVSAGGVRLRLQIDHPHIEALTVGLSGPTGAKGQALCAWTKLGTGSGTAAGDIWLRAASAAGKTVGGAWTVAIVNASGDAGTLQYATLQVEGIGRDGSAEGLASEIYRWAVRVDPALVGVTHPGDIAAARAALQRLAPAHTRSFLCFKMTGGSPVAICDDANAVADCCIMGA